jgi:hypothetical protein
MTYQIEKRDDSTIYWTASNHEGWQVEKREGRYAVYYHTNEVMRLSADGVLSFGEAEPYWFKTLEWALLCKQRLQSLDRAFNRHPSMSFSLGVSGNVGIGTSSNTKMFEIRLGPTTPVISIEQDGRLSHIDLPYFFMGWWRNTIVYRAWRKLMWGEKA